MNLIHFTKKADGFDCWLPTKDFKSLAYYKGHTIIKFGGESVEIIQDYEYILKQLREAVIEDR